MKTVTELAQQIADQELEACMEWMRSHFHGVPQWADELHAARRPQPTGLVEQALTKINAILGDPRKSTLKDEIEALELSRRALERLQELESNG